MNTSTATTDLGYVSPYRVLELSATSACSEERILAQSLGFGAAACDPNRPARPLHRL